MIFEYFVFSTVYIQNLFSVVQPYGALHTDHVQRTAPSHLAGGCTHARLWLVLNYALRPWICMSKSSVLVMIAYIHIIVDNRGFGTWHVKQTLGIRELGIALSAKYLTVKGVT